MCSTGEDTAAVQMTERCQTYEEKRRAEKGGKILLNCDFAFPSLMAPQTKGSCGVLHLD